MARPADLIAVTYRRLIAEIPALDRLKLLLRLELRGRGDVQVFGVRMPGPTITKGEPDNPRIELSIPRADFNQLAEKGSIADWKDSFDRGVLKVAGSSDIQKLIATVIARHQARAPFRGRPDGLR